MNSRRRRSASARSSAAVLVAPLVVLLALTGCSPGGSGGAPGDGPGDGPGSVPADGGTASGRSDTGCLSERNWNLDVADAAAQLLANLQAAGSPAVSATGTGSQQIFFSQSGEMGSTTDVTFVIVMPMDSGLTMTMTQHQTGPANGDWAWIDDTNVVGFSDWVSGYQVTTTVDINGTPSTTEFPLPSSDSAGTNMTVVCSGDSLTTKAEGSPFTQNWTAGD